MAWPPEDGKPYMPANGTEGEIFEGGWCERCTHDAEFREQFYNGDNVTVSGCSILAMATGGCGQPPEWKWQKGRPVCTKFTDEPLPAQRCPHTLELFA